MNRHEHMRGPWPADDGAADTNRDATHAAPHAADRPARRSPDSGGREGFEPARSGGGGRPFSEGQLDSKDLFAAGRVVTIAHGDQLYQLRLTAQNKLILTK